MGLGVFWLWFFSLSNYICIYTYVYQFEDSFLLRLKLRKILIKLPDHLLYSTRDRTSIYIYTYMLEMNRSLFVFIRIYFNLTYQYTKCCLVFIFFLLLLLFLLFLVNADSNVLSESLLWTIYIHIFDCIFTRTRWVSTMRKQCTIQ